MKFNKLSLLLGLILTTVSVLGVQNSAKADLWCWPGEKNCKADGKVGTSGNDIFGRSRNDGSGSCLQVMTSDVYKVTFVNDKSYQQTYYFDNQKYTLSPGYQRSHSKTIASGTNSCNVQTYPLPVVEFDRYSNDGQYTARRVKLSRNKTKYTFWKDGNIIKFGG